MGCIGKSEIRESAEQGLKADLALQAGERGADAVVNPAGERQVLGCVGASDVEPVGIGEDGWIAVGATQQQDGQRTGRYLTSRHLGVPVRDAPGALHR